MILHSQLFSRFVPLRENSWLVHSHCPETPSLPIPPIFPRIHRQRASISTSGRFLCVLCLLGGYLLRVFVSSWLQVNYAKQTQFPKRQNLRNLFYPKDLHQYSAQPNQKKQTQTKPIPPNAIRDTRHAIRETNPIFSRHSPVLCMAGKWKT